MPRSITPVLVVVAAILGGAAIGVFGTSRVYWGYWLRVPSAAWLVADVASLERFTSFACCDRPSESGRHGMQVFAAAQMEATGDLPIANLPSALVRKGLFPSSGEAVPAAVLVSVRSALDAEGLLISGDAQYQYSKTIWGHVALARDQRGGALVLAAVWSGEVSNDHHAYYEVRFDRTSAGDLTVVGIRRYWWDFAGLEGLAHWLGGFAGAIAGAVCALAFLLLRTADRRRLRNAVDSPS